MTLADIATPSMIAEATNLISNGFRSRIGIIHAMRSYGATEAQAEDAIRAARLSLPYSTRYLAPR